MADALELRLAIEEWRKRQPHLFEAQRLREERRRRAAGATTEQPDERRAVSDEEIRRWDGLCWRIAREFTRERETPCLEAEDYFQECRAKVFELLSRGKRVSRIALQRRCIDYMRSHLPPELELGEDGAYRLKAVSLEGFEARADD